MNANTIRLTEQRDEAQSQVRSLETDVRLLRAALDEAREQTDLTVNTLRKVQMDFDESVELLRTLSDRDNYEPYFLAIVDAFLSRIDAGRDKYACNCGDTPVHPPSCPQFKAGAR